MCESADAKRTRSDCACDGAEVTLLLTSKKGLIARLMDYETRKIENGDERMNAIVSIWDRIEMTIVRFAK